MHWIDWTIIVIFLSLLTIVAIAARRYTRSVADFLAANRCAGRYLLTIADASAGVGTMFIVANFEKYYHAGMAVAWWGNMLAPLFLIMALSGWVIYRYRETRAMTMAEFFEMRYSRRFRIFAGTLAWIAGVIGFGIIPAVTARFFIYFCRLPIHYYQLGPLELNLTLGVVMFILLAIAVLFTLMGGQIAVIITDFFQGQFMNIVLLGILVVVLSKFHWSDIAAVLHQAPPGRSLVNPFDQADITDFNVFFYAMTAFLVVYGYMSSPATQGYYCAAKSPHEAKMARMLAGWRYAVVYLLMMMMPIGAYVMLHSDLLPAETAAVRTALDAVSDQTIRNQITVPLAMTEVLPVGLVGLFAAVMFAATISTDDTLLHSWGSIFVQDILLPLRRKPLPPDQHLRWLRLSILCVAIFAWLFSMLFPLNDYLFMFTAITGAIYAGGAGAVVIGGLYWKRGTTAGAWTAMIVGAVLAVVGLGLKNGVWRYLTGALKQAYPDWHPLQSLPDTFPLNGMHLSVIAAACAGGSYVIVSLLTRVDPEFDMDRMLHRGRYARSDGDHATHKPVRGWKVLAMGPEFSRGDKFIYLLYLGWTVLTVGWFTIFSLINLLTDVSNHAWSTWWAVYIGIGMIMGIFTTVWFLWGGFRDLFDMFRTLRSLKRNALDDGTVRP